MANKLLTANQKTVNFKMYKHGKQWLFASATALALALAGTTVTAHADTTAATTTTGAAGGQGQSAQVTQPATQNQAGAGAADTITTYPHKDVIDNAVKGAQGTEGLEIIKDNDQTIKADNQADAAQQIEKDYNSQVQDIKDAQTRVEKGRHQQSNYQTYNNMHGDTSSLDQAVQNAKGIPGLNVVKDADNKSSFSSDDDDALAKWGTVTQKEYQSEVDAINKAVDTQKQNNQDYENQLKKVIDSYSPDKAIRTDHIYVDGKLATIASDGSNKQVDVSVSNAELSNDPINEYIPFQSDKARTKYAYNLSKDSVIKVKVHNAATDSSGRQLDVTYTFSDFVLYDYNASFISDRTDGHNVWMAFGKGWPGVLVNTGTNNIAGYNVNESFTYTDGTPYTGKILISFASLDMAADNSGAEAIMPKSGVLGAFVNPKSHIGTTPVAIKGPATALTPKVYMCETPNVTNGIVGDYTDASIVFLANGNSNYTYVKWGGLTSHDGGFEPNGKPLAKNTNNGYAYEHTAYGTGNLGVDPIIRKTTEIHYHYNTSTVKLAIPS